MKFLQTTTSGLLSSRYLYSKIYRQTKKESYPYGATLLFRLYAIYNYLELIGQFGKFLF